MQTYYINLHRRPDRDIAFRRRNRILEGATKRVAVDGTGIDRTQLIQQGVIADPLPGYTDGALGNALSHRQLWQRCVEQGKPLTILEDDVTVSNQFLLTSREFVEGLGREWHIVLWCWNPDSPLFASLLGGVAAATINLAPTKLGHAVQQFQEVTTRYLPLRVILSVGIAAYSITPHAAQHLLDHCFPLRSEFIEFRPLKKQLPNYWLDAAMSKFFHELNTYCCFPPMAWTDNEKADSDVAKLADVAAQTA